MILLGLALLGVTMVGYQTWRRLRKLPVKAVSRYDFLGSVGRR